jgi:hypothetical protein
MDGTMLLVEDTDKGKPRESGGRKANGTDDPQTLGETSLPGCRSNPEIRRRPRGAAGAGIVRSLEGNRVMASTVVSDARMDAAGNRGGYFGSLAFDLSGCSVRRIAMTIPDARQFVGRSCSVTYRDRLGVQHNRVLTIQDLAFVPLYGAYLVGDIEEVCLDRVMTIKPVD